MVKIHNPRIRPHQVCFTPVLHFPLQSAAFGAGTHGRLPMRSRKPLQQAEAHLQKDWEIQRSHLRGEKKKGNTVEKRELFIPLLVFRRLLLTAGFLIQSI